MPPEIGMIATPQNFTLGTEFRLMVPITGVDTSLATDTVEVSGLLEGLSYYFESGMLTVTGTPTRLVSGKNMKILATNASGPTEKNVIFNVVPAAPVIQAVTAPPLYKGHPYSFFVPITNIPQSPTAEGLWTGIIFNRHTNDEGQHGLLISGVVPNKEFTVNSGEIIVKAPWGTGLEVSRNFQVNIPDGSYWAAILNYVASSRLVEFTLRGTDGVILPSTTRITADITGEGGRTLSTVYEMDISLFFSRGRLSIKGENHVLQVDLRRISGTGSLRQYFEVSHYTSDTWFQSARGWTNASGDLDAYQTNLSGDPIWGIDSRHPVVVDLPSAFGSDIRITSIPSTYASYDSVNGRPRIDINNLRRTAKRSSRLSLPNVNYGTGYSENIVVDGSGFNTNATLVFKFNIDGVAQTVEFPNFNYKQNRSETKYFQAST